MLLQLLSILAVVATLAVALLVLGYFVVTGVPPVPAKSAEARDVVALLHAADLPPRPTIYELGCGIGTLAVAIARAFPEARVVGVELSPVPWALARLRALRCANVRIERCDFRRIDLSHADAVTAYLMMAPMTPLAEQLDRFLRCGTPVVTVTFWFRGRHPTRVKRGGGVRGDVALYHWPARRSQSTVRANAGESNRGL